MLLTIITFIAVIGVLVFVHELGHFMAARWVGVRVKEFSIGMPPKAIGFKSGDTEYKIGWIPLGGFVRLEGQNIDDSDPSDPNNYASKTKLQRFFILVAGSSMNLLFALLLMWVFFLIGDSVPAYQKEKPLVFAVIEGSVTDKAGLVAGDTITKVQGKPIADWGQFFKEVELQVPVSDEVLITYRSGKYLREETVSLKSKDILQEQSAILGLAPYQPAIVGGFTPDSPAKQAKLKVGDLVKSVNGKAITSWQDLSERVQASEGSLLNLTIVRDEQNISKQILPIYKDSIPLIGVTQLVIKERYSIFKSLFLATQKIGDVTARTMSFLGQLVTGRASFNLLGGPVMIGAALGSAVERGFSELLFLTAFISLQLGIFNLLPIPVLDGGHILILGVEWLIRKPISPKWLLRVQVIGMVFLIGLVLLVTLNDVWRLITGSAISF